MNVVFTGIISMLKGINYFSTIILSVIFISGIYWYVINYLNFDLLSWVEIIGLQKLVLSFSFYLSAHLMRAIRLTVMMGRSDMSLRTIIATQYFTNGMNLILPFKFGELIRLYRFHKIIRRYKISFSVVIAEKLIDFCFLTFCLFAAYFSFGQENHYIRYTILTCGVITSLLLLLVVILPPNIKSFNLFLAKRYSGKFILSILSISSKTYIVISVIKDLLRQKMTTISILTLLIWSFEIGAFVYISNFLPTYKLIVLLAFLVFMADFIPSVSLGLGGIQLAFYLVYLMYSDYAYMELSIVYQIFIFFPAIILSCGIFIWERIMGKSLEQPIVNYSYASWGPISFRIWVNKMISFFKV